MRILLAPAAGRELREAIRFYEELATGLGGELLDEFERARDQIAALPDSGIPYHHDTRRVVTRRFPYSVIYRKKVDRIEIVAVAHQRRRPDYWKDR